VVHKKPLTLDYVYEVQIGQENIQNKCHSDQRRGAVLMAFTEDILEAVAALYTISSHS
jgi:hypothetical protein